MTRSKIFFYFCLCFIFGIFISSVIGIPRLLMSGLVVLALILSLNRKVMIGFCLIFLVLGIWRYQISELEIKNNELRMFNDSGEVIVFTGIIAREPDVRINSQKLTVQTEKGKVLVTASKYPEYKYGDKLMVEGKMETPGVFEDFNYKDYLAKSKIYSVIYWSEIKLLDRGNYNLIYAKILGFKDKMRKVIYQNLSPPQSSILGAMILGDKSRMSNELKEKLSIAGVRHVTAISGMHVVILTGILMSLLLGLGFWRNQAFYFSIILISFFIIMSGLQPSSVRAGIMGGILLLSQKIGRRSVSSRIIVLAGALMLAVNPLLLTSDVGFQLSFLAAMGIIYLSKTLERWLKFIPEFLNWRSILVMTFSAYIFTLPILIYNFGRISLIGPIVNILILPAVPLIMISGFIFTLLGMAWSSLAWILSWPVWFLLTYLFKVVDFFSQEWMALNIEETPAFWLIYLILGYWVWYLNKKERFRLG